MSLDFKSPTEVAKLSKAVKYSWEQASRARMQRDKLVRMFEDNTDVLGDILNNSRSTRAYVNLFAQYVRGLQLNLAYSVPQWNVMARSTAGVGFDQKIELLLQYYSPLIGLLALIRSWSTDCAFGDAIARISNGPSPTGVSGPVVPMAYRVPPNNFVRDWAAENIETSTFLGELYLVPLKEARVFPLFDPLMASTITEFRCETSDSRGKYCNTDAYSQEQARLLDIYLPKQNVILTYDCPTDTFGNINTTPLAITPSSINPFEVCRLISRPDSVEELSRLSFLVELHLLANDMLAKAAHQARQSKRNPVMLMGEESDLKALLDAPDGEPAFYSNKENGLDLYTLPGPEQSVIGMGQIAQQLFSELGGNLEVALGISPGAKTARQTQAMLQQTGAVASNDRQIFEQFLSNVGKKIASLAFESEVFEFNIQQRVPGTQYSYDVEWRTPKDMPRIGEINDYSFEVVPLSTGFRPPTERLSQLEGASRGIMQWMQAATMGAPINLEAVIGSYAKANDLLTELPEWWSGEKPSPQQQTSNTYTSMAAPATGSDVNYQGAFDQGNSVDMGQPQEGGLGSL